MINAAKKMLAFQKRKNNTREISRSSKPVAPAVQKTLDRKLSQTLVLITLDFTAEAHPVR